jgi:hypothetical protein
MPVGVGVAALVGDGVGDGDVPAGDGVATAVWSEAVGLTVGGVLGSAIVTGEGVLEEEDEEVELDQYLTAIASSPSTMTAAAIGRIRDFGAGEACAGAA